MSEPINSIADLRTGNPEIDDLLDKAYTLGVKQGRSSSMEDYKITLTRKFLAHIMKKANLDLQAALILLEIPKSERKTYIKHFTKSKKV